jgi:hypothetical protein
MRQIILILSISILSFGSIVAQQKQGQTKNLDAFVGTWEYKTENELFRIVFIKGIRNDKYFLYDCVIGGYLYIKNRDTIGDYTKNIPFRYLDNNTKDITIMGSNIAYDPAKINPNRIWLIFTDRKIGKTTWGFGFQNNFTLLSPTEARFQVFNDEGIDGEDIPEEFSVPVDVVMKKVK